jgi:nucleoid-associated protein YgaU
MTATTPDALVLKQPSRAIAEPKSSPPLVAPSNNPPPTESTPALASASEEKVQDKGSPALEPSLAITPQQASEVPTVEPPREPLSSELPSRSRPTTWRRHRIKDGDTLAKLAQIYLGDATREEEIFAFNRDVLADPEILPIARWLRIPPEESFHESAVGGF